MDRGRKKGEKTREKLMDVAQELILKKGFSGTSLDEVIEAAGITKGGFYYHFKDKNDLARALMERFLAEDRDILDGLIARARQLSEDPLQQMLVFLKLYAEFMADIPGSHPGCLVASYTYESQQFDEEIRAMVAEGVLSWRQFFVELLERVAAAYPMRIETSTTELADMLSAIVEGGIVVSLALNNPNILVEQINLFRSHIRLLFEERSARRAA